MQQIHEEQQIVDALESNDRVCCLKIVQHARSVQLLLKNFEHLIKRIAQCQFCI